MPKQPVGSHGAAEVKSGLSADWTIDAKLRFTEAFIFFLEIKSDLTMFVPQHKRLRLGMPVTSKRSDKLQLS